MSSYRRCRQRYYWSYIANLVTPSSAGQMRGTVGHAALGEWYKTWNAEKAMQKASDEMFKFELDTGRDCQEDWDLISGVLTRYFAWSLEMDKSFKLLAVEQEFNIELADGLVLKGFIDGVLDINGSVWLLENKFNKQASVEHVDLDPQVSIYMLAAYELGYNPMGCLYNVVRMADGKKAHEEPALRSKVYRNAEGLSVIRAELIEQMHEMEEFHKGNVRVFRNPTKDCKWDCSFYTACLATNYDGSPEAELSRFPIRPPDEIVTEGDVNND